MFYGYGKTNEKLLFYFVQKKNKTKKIVGLLRDTPMEFRLYICALFSVLLWFSSYSTVILYFKIPSLCLQAERSSLRCQKSRYLCTLANEFFRRSPRPGRKNYARLRNN